MSEYKVRINYKGIHINAPAKIQAKVAFKTREEHWLHTELPVLVLISIHSVFHEGINGDLKLTAFLSTMKKSIKGPISILLANTAHIHTLQLKDQNKALDLCMEATEHLKNRYQTQFEGCNLLYWNIFIQKHTDFKKALLQVETLYENDQIFQKLLIKDAEVTYTEKRREEYPNKLLFIDKTIQDLLEQAACLIILSREGYRYQFYPGASYVSIEYVNERLLLPKERVHWINVFLSIEQKKVLENT